MSMEFVIGSGGNLPPEVDPPVRTVIGLNKNVVTDVRDGLAPHIALDGLHASTAEAILQQTGSTPLRVSQHNRGAYGTNTSGEDVIIMASEDGTFTITAHPSKP